MDVAIRNINLVLHLLSVVGVLLLIILSIVVSLLVIVVIISVIIILLIPHGLASLGSPMAFASSFVWDVVP